MSTPALFAAKIASGTAGAATLDNTFDFRGFTAGQPLYFGFFYRADRTTGSNTETLSSIIRWWDGAGTELTPTTSSITIDATTAGFLFYERPHLAPANAVRGRVKFGLTPGGASFQHDIQITAIRVSKTEAFASVDATIAVETPIIIYADATGTPKPGELSRTITVKLLRLGVTVADATWAVSLLSGNVTYTSSVTAGVLTLVLTGPNDATLTVESKLRLTGTYGDVPRTADIKVLRQDDQAPPSGGGGGGGGTGTTGTASSLGNTTGTAYDTVNATTNIFTVHTGSSGRIDFAAPIQFKRTSTVLVGATGCAGKWQWRAVGGTFADAPAGEIMYSFEAEKDGEGYSYGGSISADDAKTGLTANTDYEVRFIWRRVNISGAASEVYRTSGALTATGS